MDPQKVIKAYQKLIPFSIKFKNQSVTQKILAFLVGWYIPTYLTHYTTVIGRSIYFPSQRNMESNNTVFTIAHEVVHLLDQKRLTTPIFILIYLSPQIFAVGIFLFPWLGYKALYFLLFGLPWPSPGRVYLETRAYALEIALYMRCQHSYKLDNILDVFQSSGYYFMSWNRKLVERQIAHWVNKISDRSDPILYKVLSTFEGSK